MLLVGSLILLGTAIANDLLRRGVGEKNSD
jgi:hypothetical protein